MTSGRAHDSAGAATEDVTSQILVVRFKNAATSSTSLSSRLAMVLFASQDALWITLMTARENEK